MLVLTRKRCQTIRIGDDVVVKVISMGRRNVKIGLEAPSHMPIRRGEVAPDSRKGTALPSDPSADRQSTEMCVSPAAVSDQFPHVVPR